MLIGIVSVQAGAGVAKSLFDEVSPTVIVWLRLVTSAAVLAAYARPHLRRRTASDWVVVLGFGASLGLMNLAIYQSFARIPLGIAVTIEFIGPLTLAVVGSRRARDLVWVGLAGLGVALLGLERSDLDLVGVLWALLAGAMWASYILLSGATGRRWEGLDGLAMASVVAAALLTPLLALKGTAPARGHVRHPDEPGARRSGTGRHRGAQRVPQPGAVGGGGLRDRRQHRRHPAVGDHRRTGASLREACEFTQLSRSSDDGRARED